MRDAGAGQSCGIEDDHGATRKKQYWPCLKRKTIQNGAAVTALAFGMDEEIIAELTQVRGIGLWTTQMFLMFRLGRPDVLPHLDLGIRKGLQRTYGLEELPTPQQVLEMGDKWRPHCTLACWYLWRSLEIEPPVPV